MYKMTPKWIAAVVVIVLIILLAMMLSSQLAKMLCIASPIFGGASSTPTLSWNGRYLLRFADGNFTEQDLRPGNWGYSEQDAQNYLSREKLIKGSQLTDKGKAVVEYLRHPEQRASRDIKAAAKKAYLIAKKPKQRRKSARIYSLPVSEEVFSPTPADWEKWEAASPNLRKLRSIIPEISKKLDVLIDVVPQKPTPIRDDFIYFDDTLGYGTLASYPDLNEQQYAIFRLHIRPDGSVNKTFNIDLPNFRLDSMTDRLLTATLKDSFGKDAIVADGVFQIKVI